MADLVQWNNCAGCTRKRSLLSEQPSYIISHLTVPMFHDIALKFHAVVVFGI